MRRNGYVSIQNGLVTELIQVRSHIEQAFIDNGREVLKKQINEDMMWLHHWLLKERRVKYLKVVTRKMKDAKLVATQGTFTAYWVKRKDPSYITEEAIFLHIVPVCSKR